MLDKRPNHITTDRLFLTPNHKWKLTHDAGWYKNCPIGINTMSKWTQQTATQIGLDTKNKKFTNHSHRSSAVTHLAQSEITEQELMKITGHTSSNSLKPYLNMQSKRHEEILSRIRNSSNTTNVNSGSNINTTNMRSESSEQSMFFQCTFNVQNFNCGNL